MPREARQRSASGYYHVIAKGSGNQNLFEGPRDYEALLHLLDKACEKDETGLIAYCLMSNHIHLLMDDPNDCLSDVMHAVLTRYAIHFNGTGGHIGHVFQQRFRSQPIEDEQYLLQAVRYIHNNPVKANIAEAMDYPWSSYREYVGKPIHVDTSLILDMCGGVDEFVRFSQAEDEGAYRFMYRPRITEGEARAVAEQLLGNVSLAGLKTLEPLRRNELLSCLKGSGLSIRQIERLTGIGRSIISRA